MTTVKELGVEDLQRDLGRLQGLRTEAEARIRALQEAVDLAEARDAELARQEFGGADHRKERIRLDETRTVKTRERAREVADFGLLAGELQRVEAALTVAKHQAQVARAGTLAATVAAEIAGLAQELREALAAPLERLVRAEKTHQELQALWEDLDRGQFLGGQGLVRLRYFVDQLVAGAKALEGGAR